MLVQNNNNYINFGANHIRTIRKIAGSNKVNNIANIYSIDKTDKAFLERFISNLDNEQRFDKAAIKEKATVNETLKMVLEKALHLDKKSKDSVYIAVNNKNQVCGSLDFTNSGIPVLKNVMVWGKENKSAIRGGLLTEFLRHVNKINNSSLGATDIYSYCEPKIPGNKVLKSLGFKTVISKYNFIRERLRMASGNIRQNIKMSEESLEKRLNIKFSKNQKHESVQLDKLDI